MYLYSRVVDVRGNDRRALALAVEITEYVRPLSTGPEVTLWRAAFGGPAGSLAWSSWTESLEAFDAGAALMDDEGLNQLVDRGDTVFARPRDLLRELVHGEPPGEPPPLGAVGTVTTATMTGGRYEDAVGWGIEIAQLVEEITSIPVAFLTDAVGTFGKVTWLSVSPDPRSADEANAKVNGNDKYLSRLRDTGELFLQGSGDRRLYRRVC